MGDYTRGIDPVPPADEMARLQKRFYEIESGAAGDALLYLAPAAELMRAPTDPNIWMDDDYRKEIMRRTEVRGRKPLSLEDQMRFAVTPPQPWWPR